MLPNNVAAMFGRSVSIPSLRYACEIYGCLWHNSTIAGRLVLATVGGMLFIILFLCWTLLDLMLYACNKTER